MKRHWRGGVRTAHFDGAMVMRCQTRESKSDLTGSGQWKQAAFSQEHGPSLQHRNVSTPPSLRFRWSSIKSGGRPMSCSKQTDGGSRQVIGHRQASHAHRAAKSEKVGGNTLPRSGNRQSIAFYGCHADSPLLANPGRPRASAWSGGIRFAPGQAQALGQPRDPPSLSEACSHSAPDTRASAL
jgi:hypothetical protein